MISRRTVCAGMAASLLARPARAAKFDAQVRRRGGTHSSLAAALSDAPAGPGPYRILLGAGRWEEKLAITRPNVTLIGEERGGTMLTSSTAAGHRRPSGGTWGTFGSATLIVDAPGFTARNLTIENGFDYVGNLRTRAVEGPQAVALLLGNAADRSLIEACNLLGHQDTFYLRGGRALVRRCLIAGSVDFVFGSAAALFEDCEIRSRLRPGEALQGYVAAPSTHRDQSFGLVFDRCRLTRERGVPTTSVYLGRPWRAGGNVALSGAAAYLRCWMDGHIRTDGWTSMHYRGPGDYRMTFQPGDARFFEHASRGPGARRSLGRRQLNSAQAALFSRRAILGDWTPAE